ncbi:MAG: pantoate--beta-alanine ligase [Flavobacteriales bacterium]
MATQVFTTISELRSCILDVKASGRRVAFVPTMGALHEGHISLIEAAKSEVGFTIASIFVNPTQFNNPADLEKYPRMEDKDIALLADAACDVVFIPSVDEMYANLEKGHWDYGILSSTLEGHFRPGHFDGVLTIVKRFFEIVDPDVAYFGEKDFQQLSHIQRLVKEEMPSIEIKGCPTKREEDGLAMSSRNMRLSAQGRELSLHISRILFDLKEKKSDFAPAELEDYGRTQFDIIHGIELEYLEIIDSKTFAPVPDWDELFEPVAVVAAYVEGVRLIDNIRL